MTISDSLPEEPTYRKDFQESINLFEKGFKGVQTSTFDEQRSQYVLVMHESLKTMQESASGLVNNRLIELKNSLAKNLDEYLDSPTSVHQEKVQNDINAIKREE
jgi:hypothetical protein